jgi:hypothetical protein
MATKSADTTPQETPERLALTEATSQVSRLTEARRDAVADLERLSAILGPTDQHTGRVLEENIQPVPGTTIGRLFTRGVPPSKPSTASRSDIARARLALPSAQERCLVAEADLADAQRALHAARHALGLRQLRDALPVVTAELDHLLTEAETVAVKAATFTAERLLPLLEASPQATAISECRPTELEMLSERAPKLRALLSALRLQYSPSTNGGPE